MSLLYYISPASSINKQQKYTYGIFLSCISKHYLDNSFSGIFEPNTTKTTFVFTRERKTILWDGQVSVGFPS